MREKFESLRSPPGTACLVCRASQYACIAVTAHPPYHQAAIWVHDVRLSAVRARAVAGMPIGVASCATLGVLTWRRHAAAAKARGLSGRRRDLSSLLHGSFVERTADLAMDGQQCDFGATTARLDVGATSARLNSGAETARLWCEDRPDRLRTAAASRGVCVASIPTRAASAARLVVWYGQARARSFTTRRVLLLARRWCDDCSAQFWWQAPVRSFTTLRVLAGCWRGACEDRACVRTSRAVCVFTAAAGCCNACRVRAVCRAAASSQLVHDASCVPA